MSVLDLKEVKITQITGNTQMRIIDMNSMNLTADPSPFSNTVLLFILAIVQAFLCIDHDARRILKKMSGIPMVINSKTVPRAAPYPRSRELKDTR